MEERWVSFSRITGDNSFLPSYVNMATIVEVQEFDWGGGRIGSYLYADVDTAMNASRGRHSIPAREPASHFLPAGTIKAQAQARDSERAGKVRPASEAEMENADTTARAMLTGGMGGAPKGVVDTGPSLAELKAKHQAGKLTNAERERLAVLSGGVIEETEADARLKAQIAEDAALGHKPTRPIADTGHDLQSAKNAEKADAAARR